MAAQVQTPFIDDKTPEAKHSGDNWPEYNEGFTQRW